MRILELRASNFSRLRAIEIRPDPNGSLVPITGLNSSGKTSTLKAIWTALKGRAVAPPRPIHDGAEEAEIRLDLGTLKVIRKFSTDKHSGEVTTDLTVLDEAGAKMRRSPQAVIDGLLGDLSFDPLAFARAKPEDQYVRLRALVPGVDFDALAKERQELYDERTMVNRQAKEHTTLAEGIKLPPGPEPTAVNVADLVARLQSAGQHNSGLAAAASRIQVRKAQIEAMKARLRSLQDEERKLQDTIGQLRREIIVADGDMEEEAANLPAPVDVSEMQAKLAGAQQVDEVRKLFVRRRDYLESADRAQAESTELTTAIEAVDKKARDAIASAKLPAGLSLDASTKAVLLNGKPLSVAGTAERIVASTEVAMALNPMLRVMLIDDGSELDRAHMDILAHLAVDRDYQVWVSRVEEGEAGVGFRIEDGTNAGASSGGTISDATLDRAKGKGGKR